MTENPVSKRTSWWLPAAVIGGLALAIAAGSVSTNSMVLTQANASELDSLQAGSSAEVAVEVTAMPSPGFFDGRLLEKQDSGYRHTDEILHFRFADDVTVAMGQRSDVKVGAILSVEAMPTGPDTTELEAKRVVILTGYVSSVTSGADSQQDKTAIKSLIGDFAALWHKSDAHGLSMFWSPDGDFINPDGLVMNGRQQIEDFYAHAFAMGYAGTTATATIDNVRFLKPEIAVVDGAFGISGMVAADHQALPSERGRYTVILRKLDGRWWIVSNREMEPPHR